ncbi:SDR family NAD(P)-dependent oxidoreductase [Leptospira ilyithenensis]|uniref:SDR family NAD(P)-dependent oxidoreductase n=1 Tax=Leptospira ilyithenensis TaxID=2484901 RepID=A0A4R9LSZ6_9LEPT|nr:SDR family NAD(P)-dependent oxidoreductase [Leptospira ilyithenensis]TGN14617.1 SDR family NAD(P)-dependent oxidoreductase [Leptospira ilyithenensis]
MKDFWNNRVVVITGASSGIGLALLENLSRYPCEIFALARRANDIEDPPSKHPACKIIRIGVDLQDTSSVLDALAILHSHTSGGVDVLFNNAGITAHGRFDELSLEVYRKTFATNFFGPIQLIQGLLGGLKKAKGVVVTTSTVSALYGVPGRAAYSSSKSALHAAMESMRIELKEEGVRSSLVCVPYTETNLRKSGLDVKGNVLDEGQAKAKLKTPKEVAFLLMKVAKDKEARLVTFDFSGSFMKWMRNLAPGILEKILYKKLYHDFH